MQDSSGKSFEQQLAELEVERQVGGLTAFEYSARKKALLARRAQARGAPSAGLPIAEARPLPASWGPPPVVRDHTMEPAAAVPVAPAPSDAGAAAEPAGSPAGISPLKTAASRGRLGDLPDRIETVLGELGARWRTQDRYVEVLVPLEGSRSHVAKVFVVDGTEPFCEGEPMLGVEADIGELNAGLDVSMLLGGLGGVGYARVVLVRSSGGAQRLVAQGFLPLARVRDQDLAALVYQVCLAADRLGHRIPGADTR